MMFLVIVALSCIALPTEAMLGPGGSQSCPVTCDVRKDIQNLWQLINQESLFRMNLDRQMNDLKEIVKSNSEERGLLQGKVLRLENATQTGKRELIQMYLVPL